MAHEDHVHQEIKVFKVEPHVKMVTKQYFAACHLPDHTGGLQNLQVVLFTYLFTCGKKSISPNIKKA